MDILFLFFRILVISFLVMEESWIVLTANILWLPLSMSIIPASSGNEQIYLFLSFVSWKKWGAAKYTDGIFAEG